MEFKKGLTHEEIAKKVSKFMDGVERGNHVSERLAIVDATVNDIENNRHVFVGVDLFVLPKDYMSGEFTQICRLYDDFGRTIYESDGEYLERRYIEFKTVKVIEKKLGAINA